jgi:hypothetical protein
MDWVGYLGAVFDYVRRGSALSRQFDFLLTMKQLFLSTLLTCAAFAQSPQISTYTLTAQDCNPLSMLMLFRPQGFTCTPSTTVLITGSGELYEVEIEYRVKDGTPVTEHTFLRSESGEAKWRTLLEGVKVLKVTATPLTKNPVPLVSVF